MTPLHVAARDGKTEVAAVLIINGANPNAIDVVSIIYLVYYILVMSTRASM